MTTPSSTSAAGPPMLALVVVEPDRDDTWHATVVDAGGDVHHLGPARSHELRTALVELEQRRRPRWVWWGHDAACAAAALDLRPARCHDLAATHRLLHGGWRADPGRIWAAAHGLDLDGIPAVGPADLFSTLDDQDTSAAIREDGYLTPEWVDGSWTETPERRETWARLALDVAERQLASAATIEATPALPSTIRSESAAAALAGELEVGGLPFVPDVAEEIISSFVGPRPADRWAEQQAAADRDHLVLAHVPDGADYDLRSPEQVKSMLRRCGVEVPDTRSWRLERLLDAHPVVGPLLEWRRAERISTTFGYRWIDEHVRSTGRGTHRLHGEWASSDGAAGRMTATAGLHNMPAELRPAVAADPGHRFVRADLGQIEPRILAAVAGDDDLARAAEDDDMYAPVASRLGVSRDVAKVAVLGAMYGQTTGVGAAALQGLRREYPVAMALLEDADRAAQGGNDLRTFGGRLVRFSTSGDDGPPAEARRRAAARGRFGRNAMIQGAAAEFFKVWAVLVRARGAGLDARVALCLHDELLVHVPADRADAAAALLDEALREAAARWLPAAGPRVRFVADATVVERWSDVS